MSMRKKPVPVRRSVSKPLEAQCQLRMVRAEAGPTTSGGKQLVLVLYVKRGTSAWLIVRTAVQLVELQARLTARLPAAVGTLKLPTLPDLNARAGRSASTASGAAPPTPSEGDEGAGDEVEQLPVSLEPIVSHKLQEFLRLLVGDFAGPEVDYFISAELAPSRPLNRIEAWLYGPEAEKRISRQGDMSEFNARTKHWEPCYLVLRGSSLIKHRSARQEGEPVSVFELGKAATARATDVADAQVPRNDSERFMLELENGSKVRRFACASKLKADQWIDAFNQLNSSNGTGGRKKNVVFGVELRRVAHVKNDPFWCLSGPKPRQGTSFIACGAVQYIDELTGFLLAVGKGKEGLFDQSPDADLVHHVQEGESVDYTSLLHSPEKVAGILLMFLHQLPEPIIPCQYHDCLVAAFRIQDERSRRKVVKLLMSLLSSINLKVLRLLVGFLDLFVDTLPKNSRRHVINAFAGTILRPQSHNDVVSYASTATVRLLELLMVNRHKFWDYEEGFGEGEDRPSRSEWYVAGAQSAIEIRTKVKIAEPVEAAKPVQAPAIEAQDAETDSSSSSSSSDGEESPRRMGRSGTMDLFSHMAKGAASMRRSPAAKRRDRRRKSFIFQKEGAATSPRPTPRDTSPERLPGNDDASSPLKLHKQASDVTPWNPGFLSTDSDKEGAHQKVLGPAAKRRERRKRSLTRERASASDESSAEATTAESKVSAAPAASMNARLAEIARLKQQRMVESNDSTPTARAANNQAYRAVGGGSSIVRRPQKQDDATTVMKEKKEAKETGLQVAEEEEPEPQLTPFLRALQTSSLAKGFITRCVEVSAAGEERLQTNFDPSQQVEKRGELRSWNS